jgi:hypothetical protein
MPLRKDRCALNTSCLPSEELRGPGTREEPADLGRRQDIADLDCCIQAEVARVAAGSAEQAEVLQSIGARAFEAAGLLHEHCAARELLRAAHDVQGLVTHALAVLAGLQFHAGRMHGLSAIQQAREEALVRET